MSAETEKTKILSDSGASDFLKATLRAAWNRPIGATLMDLSTIANLLAKRQKEQQAQNQR